MEWFTNQADLFAERYDNIPYGVFGAVDCTYIYVITPDDEQWFDYIDKDKDICVKAQVLCNYNYEILDIIVGYPGCVHDISIFQVSDLFRYFERGESFIANRFRILGDSAYPTRPYLVKATSEISPESARSVIENCFAQIKQQWRILMKRIDCNIDKVPQLFVACCILFNIYKRE